MKAKQSIENLVRELDIQIDPRVDQRILDNTLGPFRESAEKPPADSRPMSWREIMKTPIAKLTIAATVVVAALLGIHFLGGTSTTAWAAVLEKVNGFDTCVFRTRQVETTGPRPDGFEFATEEESKVYRSETYGSFSENYKNGKLHVRHYTLLQDQQHLSLYCQGPHKTCFRLPFKEQDIREFHNSDPRRLVAKILNGDYVEIGRDTIEGKPVTGVELRDPNVLSDDTQKIPPLDDFSALFWIDTETELPVWMEMSVVLKGSPTRTTMIWDQFQWGVPLEASLFEPVITGDYEVVDADGSVPDSTPKTTGAETFAQTTIHEPYLSDFDDLPLPDMSGLTLLGIAPKAPASQVRLLGQTEIRMAQDACVAGWPRYEQVQAQLRQELQDRLNIGAMNTNELMTTGIALRNLFWEIGACLSDTSYPYVYGARLMMEVAHEQAPENSAVIDQLVETIVTYEVAYYCEDPSPNQVKRNAIYPGVLADLRMQQFEQLKAKAGQDYAPTWKDFVRTSDHIRLIALRGDYAAALEATRWLIERAETAGWTYYLDGLKRGEQLLVAGERYKGPVTFLGSLTDVSLDRYGRRLWSFQGPQEYRQSRLPTHLRHLKGW